MTDIATYQPNNELAQQMEFARMVAAGDARNSILPQAYRGNPANALVAVGLGAAMGLSPAESLYRIDVINGTPSAAGELIAQNVRRAGHKLRVQVSENPPSATATIIRADDPDYPVTITRDMEWAKGMGLAGKDNYKKQPATMLQWRAITAAARLACPEALYGVTYVADELEDMPRAQTVTATATTTTVTASDFDTPAPDVQDADEAHDEPASDDGPRITKAQQRRLFMLFKAKGIPEHQQRGFLETGLGRVVTSRTAITPEEYDRTHSHLETMPDAAVPAMTDADKVYAELTALSGRHGVADAQVRTLLEQRFAQPVEDLTVEQLREALDELKARIGDAA